MGNNKYFSPKCYLLIDIQSTLTWLCLHSLSALWPLFLTTSSCIFKSYTTHAGWNTLLLEGKTAFFTYKMKTLPHQVIDFYQLNSKLSCYWSGLLEILFAGAIKNIKPLWPSPAKLRSKAVVEIKITYFSLGFAFFKFALWGRLGCDRWN